MTSLSHDPGVQEHCISLPHPEGNGPVRWMIITPSPAQQVHTETKEFPICLLLHAGGGLTRPPELQINNVPRRLQNRYIVIIPFCPQNEMPTLERGVVSPLVHSETAHGGSCDAKVCYNEAVLVRILEESIMRLSYDDFWKERLDLQRIQVVGYSAGSQSAFNLACTHGRLFSLVMGFGAPGHRDVFRGQGAISNCRDTLMVGFQVKFDKDEHMLTDMFQFLSSSGAHDPSDGKKQDHRFTFDFLNTGGTKESRSAVTTKFIPGKLLVTVSPFTLDQERKKVKLKDIDTMTQHDSWNPTLWSRGGEFKISNSGKPMKFLVPWMASRYRPYSVDFLSEFAYDITVSRGPCTSLFCENPNTCLGSRVGVFASAVDEQEIECKPVNKDLGFLARKAESVSDEKRVIVGVSKECMLGTPLPEKIESNSLAHTISSTPAHPCAFGGMYCLGGQVQNTPENTPYRVSLPNSFVEISHMNHRKRHLPCNKCLEVLVKNNSTPMPGDHITSANGSPSSQRILEGLGLNGFDRCLTIDELKASQGAKEVKLRIVRKGALVGTVAPVGMQRYNLVTNRFDLAEGSDHSMLIDEIRKKTGPRSSGNTNPRHDQLVQERDMNITFVTNFSCWRA